MISTVSLGHLDSLADVVAKINGTAPPRTVPDPVVRAAGEIQLVAIPPEVLRDRIACGCIYPLPEAKAALGGWFQTGNLSALRELALRWLAVTLASGPRRHRPSGQARERVVVGLSRGPEGETLIRRAARIAARSGAGLPVVGATRHSWRAALRPTTTIRSRVIRHGGGIGVHIVTCLATANGGRPAACEPNQRRGTTMQHNTSRPGRVRHAVRWARRRAASGKGRHPSRVSWLASAAVVAAALTIAACASSPPGPGGTASAPPRAGSGSASPGSPLKTTTINGATVLTNAKGFTLYSFAPDTPTTSKCTGQCAAFWPPVKGPATAGPGVTGTLGTITRSDGSAQATYNGHPLYTYIGDKSPGQAKGNGLNAAGGVWHEVTAVAVAAAAHHHHHGGPVHAPASTPPAPPATAPARPANPIPQGNGGDHDADNNGGPSDGDGNI